MFHLNNVVAATKVAVADEVLGTMLCDYLYYHVDLIGGDANMASYRAMGRKQESMDLKGGMYVSLLHFCIEAWSSAPQCVHLCAPRVQHVTASLGLLKQYEDQLGHAKYSQIQRLRCTRRFEGSCLRMVVEFHEGGLSFGGP